MQHVDSDNNSSDYEAIFQDDFTDIDSSSDSEEIMNSDSDEENKLLYLTKIGYSEVEASIAMERCGLNSSIAELTDFICTDQLAKATDTLLPVEDRKPLCNDPNYKQRRNLGYDLWKRKKQRKLEKKFLNEDDHAVYLLIPMIGSGVPTESDQITQRTLPEDAIGSPYFYYEQIHLSNLMIGFGVHTKSDQITQRTLPEDAIESSYFYYEQIHLLNPMIGSAKLTERICKALEAYDDEPPSSVQKYVSLKTIHKDLYRDMFHGGINVLSLLFGINDAEVAFYCLGILLKTDVQELNDDRLEQLMSRFGEFDLVVDGIQLTVSSAAPKYTLPYPTFPNHGKQSSKEHNGYHLDKENDRHERSSNDVSRLEPASWYNQSSGSDLLMAL
ncbi:hypothetical protein F3Y22_tig00112293pilonHSYRG00233 [Hibiscus syriacus]|uniref:DNA (Cytosine-5)-methyltransferase DRM1/2 n=1 Tax=Hibiscus syriacus TaxID=106335 RepID=A0A6A2X233_HIBSY|nr:hypothetical protein F3Y22_tig00112293pilonHSYRG00233 [Hibiscus syriacus]